MALGSGLDGHFDGFALGDDIKDRHDVVEFDVTGDEILNRNLSRGDVLQGTFVVLGGRAIGAVDVELTVMDQVRVAGDRWVRLGQAAEERNTACLLYTSPSPRD